MARKFNIASCLLSLLLVFAACESPLPKSGGSAYDVAVVSDNRLAGSVVMRELSLCTETFTDVEPMFQLSQTTGYSEDDIIRLSRTLIIVDTADIDNTVCVRERNVWAHPQLVLYITTPSAKALSYDIRELRELMAREINDFERGILIGDISRHRNMLLTDSVMKYTGVEMFVPAGMIVARTAKDFIWLTENHSDENMSLCVSRVHKSLVDTDNMESVTHLRDSVMKSYVRGARDSMFYRTVSGSERAEVRHDTILIRSRWEMVGDAMGGPSVCRILTRGDSVYVAESFVYSPATEKRDRMRRAEAVVFSIKP